MHLIIRFVRFFFSSSSLSLFCIHKHYTFDFCFSRLVLLCVTLNEMQKELEHLLILIRAWMIKFRGCSVLAVL